MPKETNADFRSHQPCRPHFLEENSEQYRTKILEALVENEKQLVKHPDRIKFICSVNDDMYEEILTYNKILEYIAKNEEQDADQAIVWKFKCIAGHQGPLKKGDPGYNGSKFNVLVEWETGESTYEPLNVIAANYLCHSRHLHQRERATR